MLRNGGTRALPESVPLSSKAGLARSVHGAGSTSALTSRDNEPLNKHSTPIIDSEGVRATAASLPTDDSSLQVTLQAGEVVFVPRALVERTDDGTYRFERSFRECLEKVAGGEIVVPVLAEQLEVGMRSVERERVRVTTSVGTREELVDVPLVQEELVVERVPVGRVVDAISSPREEGDTLIVPVYEEVLVVEKRILLKEEVRITRTRREQQHREQVTLRHEEVAVERLPR